VSAFRLPVDNVGRGCVVFVVFGDSFLVIMCQTLLLLGAMMWALRHPRVSGNSGPVTPILR
jgi:hypothetical protein